MPNWVVWKYEVVNGRTTKVPYQTNGRRAKSNDPRTWTEFDEVVAASAKFDGIGWCVPLEGDVYYWGIDVDDAIDPITNEIRIWEDAPIQPKDILELATYSEVTPSGAGFRAIGKANFPVPAGQKKKEFGERNPVTGKIPGIEMYCTGRFFTFTGNIIPGAPQTVEEQSELIRQLHSKLFPVEQAPKFPATISQQMRSTPTDTKERLVWELLTGQIPNSSRNDLTVGIIGLLVSTNWDRADIEEVVKLLVAAFNDADPSYDMEATIRKQLKELDTLYDRQANRQALPGYTFLARTITPNAIQNVRAILTGTGSSRVPSSDVEGTLTLIRNQPPESFERQEIKYLIEPEIPRGALVLITGNPGCGKSTLVMHWSIQMAQEGNEVLYLDRDNPLFIAQERIERFGGNTVNGLMYWGLWNKHANGDPLEPPYPESEFLVEAVKKMKNPVLVFDTFAAFSEGDENDNAVVGKIFKRFRHLTNLGATVLVIHHKGKNAASKYRGASAMEGAVDAGVEVIGTIEEGLLTRIEVQTFKTRIGDGKPIVYGMKGGIPYRQTATIADRLLDHIRRHPGLTKEKFEEAARNAGFRRGTIRDFIDHGIVSGALRYEKRKLSVKLPQTKPSIAELQFDDDEEPESSSVDVWESGIGEIAVQYAAHPGSAEG